ncbi:MAG: HAD-IIIC family phosphatase [Lachnospiraceae bacterium]|nr:HAD-IIIC family phosphatase [Lachnospiraceae bacterium]
MKIAVLSNINMDLIIRKLKGAGMEVLPQEGFGNELGRMLDKASSYSCYAPDITFLFTDVLELIDHEPSERAYESIDKWFNTFRNAIQGKGLYYVANAYVYGVEKWINPTGLMVEISGYYDRALKSFVSSHKNVRIFPYKQIMEDLGESVAINTKTFLMGKILHTTKATDNICTEIIHRAELEERTPKKVLVLDLDNTLWGGLCGEDDTTPILLSDSGKGLVYKNFQRVLRMMKDNGVILAIASKNNEADALRIIEKHPHMALKPEDFAARKIGWFNKDESIRELSKELSLGIDSFVFVDDSPNERKLVKMNIPEAEVPYFPEDIEKLPEFGLFLYREFFEKPRLTAEDSNKAKQYSDNVKRKELEAGSKTFDDYLRSLGTVLKKVSPGENADRLRDMLNKTNQFNLTTRRYTHEEISDVLNDPSKTIFMYSARDEFGDSGIIAALIAKRSADEVSITDFVMSCRVMGRRIEYAIIDDVEDIFRSEGVKTVRGKYVSTAKNMPVEGLYADLGYELVNEEKTGLEVTKDYIHKLNIIPDRKYYVNWE